MNNEINEISLEQRKVAALESIALWMKIGVWLAVCLVLGFAIESIFR